MGLVVIYIFKTITNDELKSMMIEFLKDKSSFYIMKPPIDKNYVSFGVVENSIINGKEKEELYYLKYRNYYSKNKKLYSKAVNKYDVIIKLKETEQSAEYNDNNKVVLRPQTSKGFYSYGDICKKYNELNKM